MMSADGVIDADGLLIENVRANLSLPSPTGSVWLRITNSTDADETLLGADVPGCGVVELHEMVIKNEVMTMQQVARRRDPDSCRRNRRTQARWPAHHVHPERSPIGRRRPRST